MQPLVSKIVKSLGLAVIATSEVAPLPRTKPHVTLSESTSILLSS
jgi:hypothetical protein